MTTNIGQSEGWAAWVDGTACPNPGRMAIGIVLVAPDGRRTEWSQALGRSGCNNEAELRAIDTALGLAMQQGATRLTVLSDSRFAVDCLNGIETTMVEPLAGLLHATRQRLSDFDAIELRWLPRHRNAEADRLARAALGLVPKKTKANRSKR